MSGHSKHNEKSLVSQIQHLSHHGASLGSFLFGIVAMALGVYALLLELNVFSFNFGFFNEYLYFFLCVLCILCGFLLFIGRGQIK